MRLILSHKDNKIYCDNHTNTQHTKCSLFNVQSGTNTAVTTEILISKGVSKQGCQQRLYEVIIKEFFELPVSGSLVFPESSSQSKLSLEAYDFLINRYTHIIQQAVQRQVLRKYKGRVSYPLYSHTVYLKYLDKLQK